MLLQTADYIILISKNIQNLSRASSSEYTMMKRLLFTAS